jgi:hypothetical protein
MQAGLHESDGGGMRERRGVGRSAAGAAVGRAEAGQVSGYSEAANVQGADFDIEIVLVLQYSSGEISEFSFL